VKDHATRLILSFNNNKSAMIEFTRHCLLESEVFRGVKHTSRVVQGFRSSVFVHYRYSAVNLTVRSRSDVSDLASGTVP
jgi:hypothetical protein